MSGLQSKLVRKLSQDITKYPIVRGLFRVGEPKHPELVQKPWKNFLLIWQNFFVDILLTIRKPCVISYGFQPKRARSGTTSPRWSSTKRIYVPLSATSRGLRF